MSIWGPVVRGKAVFNMESDHAWYAETIYKTSILRLL